MRLPKAQEKWCTGRERKKEKVFSALFFAFFDGRKAVIALGWDVDVFRTVFKPVRLQGPIRFETFHYLDLIVILIR